MLALCVLSLSALYVLIGIASDLKEISSSLREHVMLMTTVQHCCDRVLMRLQREQTDEEYPPGRPSFVPPSPGLMKRSQDN